MDFQNLSYIIFASKAQLLLVLINVRSDVRSYSAKELSNAEKKKLVSNTPNFHEVIIGLSMEDFYNNK
jgi:hypothetical protein